MSDRPFDDLVRLVAKLRDPVAGCPWDRAQDHRSLRPYLVEEAYEAIASIDSGDSAALASELGDVLLQVLLHSQIATEQGEFSVADVCERLARKLVRRHPHVFGNECPDLSAIRERWEQIKTSEGRPEFRHPTLIEARKTLDRLPEEFVFASVEPADEEERAGVRILELLRRLRKDGLDPEIAVRRGIKALRRSAFGEAST
jgi:MazG family protein